MSITDLKWPKHTQKPWKLGLNGLMQMLIVTVPGSSFVVTQLLTSGNQQISHKLSTINMLYMYEHFILLRCIAFYRKGQWNTGGRCDAETQPITNEDYMAHYPWMMKILESVIAEMKTPVFYLNITKMTDYRQDGHPSIYRQMEIPRSPGMIQDCSHWCLPGVPDSWNQLLYATLLISHRDLPSKSKKWLANAPVILCTFCLVSKLDLQCKNLQCFSVYLLHVFIVNETLSIKLWSTFPYLAMFLDPIKGQNEGISIVLV